MPVQVCDGYFCLNQTFINGIHKNGLPHFAAITLRAARDDAAGEHRIVEAYAGKGFSSQGYLESVPVNGYDGWKAGVREALKYALSKLDGYWTVTVEKLEGLSTDTNPTIAGYVAIRALWEKAGYHPAAAETTRLEDIVFSSWKRDKGQEIPDFFPPA